jgi:acyl carrier protein phosphodiesterase
MIPCVRIGFGDDAVNHLAHALLGGADDDLMFGGLVADFLRGVLDPSMPRGVRIGVALHRSIDSYTDAHAQVVAARQLFDAPYRRYAGIFLDVWFDHLLARDWSQYADGPLQDFSRHVLTLLAARETDMPTRMRDFAHYMRRNDLPAAYARRETIVHVFSGLSHRLSRANPLASVVPVIESRADAVATRFHAFFPDLQEHALRERLRLAAITP